MPAMTLNKAQIPIELISPRIIVSNLQPNLWNALITDVLNGFLRQCASDPASSVVGSRCHVGDEVAPFVSA